MTRHGVCSMNFRPTMVFWRAPLILLAMTGLDANGQNVKPAAVDVADVRFSSVRDETGEVWWMGEVAVQVEAGPSGGRARFADRVRVELQWGVEAPTAPGGFLFYRAAASAAALEAGRSVYRFYLPPEIIRRERIEAAPRYWTARVSVAGVDVPDSRRSVGAGFSSAEAVANFRRQLAVRAPAQDGVLLPWYLTPFAHVAAADDVPVPMRAEAFPSS